MCGRYRLIIEQSSEIAEIFEKGNTNFRGKGICTGEVFPTNLALILIEEKQQISAVPGIWGFPNLNEKGVLINARAETAFEKRTFRDSLVNRRCIIPSTGFYEWDGSKRKYLFQLEDSNTLYMAGLYMYYGDELRYVILTTAANASIQDIHNRMPLIIPKKDIAAWIMDNRATNDLLHRVPPLLVKEATDGQMSLF